MAFANTFPKMAVTMDQPVARTIGATGALVLPGGGHYEITSYSGTSDALTSISGCRPGEVVTLRPAATHTITVTDGANLKIGGDRDFVMDNISDSIPLYCESAGVFSEIFGRVSNG